MLSALEMGLSRKQVIAAAAGIALIAVLYAVLKPKKPKPKKPQHGGGPDDLRGTFAGDTAPVRECDKVPLESNGSCVCPDHLPLAQFNTKTRVAHCTGVDAMHRKCNGESGEDCNSLQVWGGTQLAATCRVGATDQPCTWTNLPRQ